MNAINLTSTTGTTWTAEARIGVSINEVAAQACQIARANGVQVSFDFKGINITVTPFSNATAVALNYTSEANRLAEAYRNSEEGRRAEEDRKARAAAAQEAVDKALETLDLCIKDEKS